MIIDQNGASAAADHEFRQSAARLRTVFESIDQGYCVCEMVVVDGAAVDYRFVEVNARFEEMTGLADAAGRTALELVPGLEQHWIDTYARVALGGETLRFEQGSDAMGRWFDVFAVPVAPDGYFALVFRDQTERRSTELALLESEQRFRTMADQLPMFVWKYDADGRRIWVNQTMCDFFAMSRDDMITSQWTVSTHPDDDAGLPAEFERSVHQRTTFHGEARVRRHDGAWRWIETWGRPRFAPNGEYAGHIGTSVDITERLEGERAVQRSALFLRRLIDNLFAFVGVLTPDGTLVEANRAPLEAAGIQPDDVLGRKFWEARWWSVSPETQEQLRDAVVRAAAGETVRYDVQVRGAGDTLIWIDFQLAPLRDDDGTITHLVPSGHVISERIETEQRLASALETERSTRRRVELLQRNAIQLAVAITVDDLATSLLGELRDSLGLGFTALEVVNGDQVTVIAPSDIPDATVERYRHVPLDADFAGPIAIRTNQPVVLAGREHIAERFPVVADPANELPPFETLVALPLRVLRRGGRSGRCSSPRSRVGGSTRPPSTCSPASLGRQGWRSSGRSSTSRCSTPVRRSTRSPSSSSERCCPTDSPTRPTSRSRRATARRATSWRWAATGTTRSPGRTVTSWSRSATWSATTSQRRPPWGGCGSGSTRSCPVRHPTRLRCSTPIATTATSSARRSRRPRAWRSTATTGRIRYSVAGHPAPLVLFPDGRIEWLTGAMSPPLGVPNDEGHGLASSQLAPGATVVLYSDGLIERRGEIIDAGFERLAASALRHVGAPPGALADAILADLTGDVEIADDVIVVCVRWSPAGPA